MLNSQTHKDDESEFAKEQRSLRDTYQAFNRPPGEPTFVYTLENGKNDGYLVGPTAVDVRTEMTEQLLKRGWSWKYQSQNLTRKTTKNTRRPEPTTAGTMAKTYSCRKHGRN